ncbi:hypothetical protein [Streptomyces sp. NPDC007205]|uniref:imine reductase family protein n=1 Tax=Streptomyces sp. NPDC007205 TaxID=3154316 RepID=UPI00340D34DC
MRGTPAAYLAAATRDGSGRAATFAIALPDLFRSSTAGYAHSVAIARAEGVTAGEPAPLADFAQDSDDGTYSGAVNPLASAASTMAHAVAVFEAHGIDAGVLRAVAGMARRTIGPGHGTDGFIRVAGALGRHRQGPVRSRTVSRARRTCDLCRTRHSATLRSAGRDHGRRRL